MKLHDIYAMTTMSGLHNGSGEGEGFIDNPIIRERHTLFPYVQSASLKGKFREVFGEKTDVHVQALFGPPPPDGDSHGGSVSFSDAALFAFPIRSLKGHFVWATTPHLLYRMAQRFRLAGKTIETLDKLLQTFTQPVHGILCSPEGAENLSINDRIILEEFAVHFTQSDPLFKFACVMAGILFPGKDISYLKQAFTRQLIVVNENLFRHFIIYATEVNPNISIGETGTTKKGSLRYTEYLPEETILYFIATYTAAHKPKAEEMYTKFRSFEIQKGTIVDLTDKNNGAGYIKQIFQTYQQNIKILQVGGDETIGKGIVSLQRVVL